MKRWALIVALCALMLSACSIDDWTSWGYNARNTFNDTGGMQIDQINTSNASNLRRLWTIRPTPNGCASSSVVTSTDQAHKWQRAFFLCDTSLYALNLQSRSIDWSNPSSPASSSNDPEISNGKVFVYNSGNDPSGSDFTVYDANTGKVVPGGNDQPQSDTSAPVLTTVGDWAYTGSGYDSGGLTFGGVEKTWEGASPPPNNESGWSTLNTNLNISTPVRTAPAAFNGVVYATSYDTVWAFRDSDGVPLWHASLGNGLHPLGAPLIAPTVDGENRPTLYVSGDKVWALDLATGAIRWSWGTGTTLPSGVDGGITLSNNQVLVAYDGWQTKLTSLNATTGAFGYTKTLPVPAGADTGATQHPVTANGVVYVTASGVVWATRASDGSVLKTIDDNALETPTQPTISEGLLLIPTLQGVDVWGLP